MHNNKIRKIGNSVLCSGTYVLKNWDKFLRSIIIDELCDLELPEECDFPIANAHDFLMGACNLFALALHKKFGYKVYTIKHENQIYHYFCITYSKGHKIFIDVRGMTSNFEDFMLGVLLPQNSEYFIHKIEINEDEELSEKWAKEGLLFANAIISKFPEFYSI